jgi:error-prone DNA polymerase
VVVLFEGRACQSVRPFNAIINPHLYERNRVAVTRGKILRVEGTLQNQDGVISVKALAVCVLDLSEVEVRSHDFH